MEISDRIEGLIAPSLGEMGFEVVRVMLIGGRPPTLQVMAERADGGNITVEDCAEISRTVSALLDVEDPITGSYTLEVSSPGIDRPLVRRKDFERFAGFEARVETGRRVDGRRRFRGRLIGMRGDNVRMHVDVGEVEVPFEEITRAKLVLTDELIAATDTQRST